MYKTKNHVSGHYLFTTLVAQGNANKCILLEVTLETERKTVARWLGGGGCL